ncbi:hypothetical protein [Bradyrhizobium sp. AUGA SZCCT0182]|uniref:hypothetical protein n=1 Tax=Bradyrhizobium sp. AUGA SZCCT0182 TaxID=2807667 RepID=UPI001BA5ADA4|nr:hypothetical protein [Bradyrhizobium sp. AUGA SZCCT0182]MBR1231975.1 hypothetical protein [Bradyrhizobium sp. AUGA SZCCT0182]
MNKPMPVGWKAQSEYADSVRKVASEAALKSNVTLNELLDFLGMFAEAGKIQNAIIATLTDRVKELEARPSSLKYVGVWDQQKVYGAGNFVTDGGSMFHAQRASVGERPGSGSDAWVLAVKKGKDAK